MNSSAADIVRGDVRTYTGLLASLLPGTGERVHDSAVVLLQWAIQVLGMVEKVSRNQAYHAREAATIVPQVKDHGIGIIQFGHVRGSNGLAHRRVRERIEHKIAHVVRQWTRSKAQLTR